MEYTDVIYGSLSIPEDIASIIATPLFQRLKSIRQVGLLCRFIPKAIHTRYEHCIGTYHRAKMMLDRLVENTSWLTTIPLMYRKAVEIAALLHDIGHGPFSHAWEHIADNYHHEENSVLCIDPIFKTLKGFEELHADNDLGIELIKALIIGDEQMLAKPLELKYRFIFEIVNNKQCNVDVDKWDYIKRDNYYLSDFLKEMNCNINMNFDSVFLESRVSADGAHVEYRYQDYDKIYALFAARFDLHLHCYRLPKNLALDQIIAEIVQNRSKGNINGRKPTEIQANSASEFLQLTDDNILRLVESDETNKCMLDINNIELISSEQTPHDIPNYLRVIDNLKAAGSEMPSDNEFHFYGNERDMKLIRCSRGNLIRECIFRFRPTKPVNGFQSNL